MIVPVRCMSCGKPIGHLWEKFQEGVAKGDSKKDVLDALGLDRYCCRMTLMGHVDLSETAAAFKKY